MCVFCFASIYTSVFAMQKTQKYKAHYTKKLFEQADTNHDGYVTLSEAIAASHNFEHNPLNKKRFRRADLNHDGKLSLEEAMKYRKFEVTHKAQESKKYKNRKHSHNP